MPKNRKRKCSPKPTEMQGKKEFKRKLLRLLRASGLENAYYLIPSKVIEGMYKIRFRSVRIEPASNNIPSRILKGTKKHLDDLLKEKKITIVEGGDEIALKDYLCIAPSFVYFITQNEQCPKRELLLEKFAHLIKVVEEEHIPTEMLIYCSWLISTNICRINHRFYWFEYHPEFRNNQMYDCLYMHSSEAEKININLNKIGRKVFRVGYPVAEEGVEWVSVTRTGLGIEGPYADCPVEVYIQTHAFNRLKERIDCVGASLLHFYLFASLNDLKVQRVNGHILIEYRLKDYKVGYLVFDLKKDKLVLKTFLFITMDGTPEGEKLREMWGIQAIDKKYLEIDRLSTFVLSDIKDNQELRDQFILSGCEDLFLIGEGAVDLKIDIRKASMVEAYLKVPAEVAEKNSITEFSMPNT